VGSTKLENCICGCFSIEDNSEHWQRTLSIINFDPEQQHTKQSQKPTTEATTSKNKK
jgi:hypothetical protein